MGNTSNKLQIILAVQAIQKTPDLSFRKAARVFQVSIIIFYNRINGKHARQNTRPGSYRLSELKKQAIIHYILNLDTRGFPP